jgi:tRNA(Leu) C34 or U34 (ribose-2'-O)-methylase TrmL
MNKATSFSLKDKEFAILPKNKHVVQNATAYKWAQQFLANEAAKETLVALTKKPTQRYMPLNTTMCWIYNY